MQLHFKQLQSKAVPRTPVVKAPVSPKSGIFAKEEPLLNDKPVDGLVVPPEIVIEDMRRRWRQAGNTSGVELELPVPGGKPDTGHGTPDTGQWTPVPETVPRGVHQEPISGPNDNITPISPTDTSRVVISFI
jgi:hypothetical protein